MHEAQVPQYIKKILAPAFCRALATMDQPPARLKQGFSQAASAAFWAGGVALKVHTVECWVFDQVRPITRSAGGTLTTDQITNWLKAPSLMKGDSRPAVGLRLLCLEQEDSMKWPFDKVTFEAIQHALGLTKTSSCPNLAPVGSILGYLDSQVRHILVLG